MSPKAIQLFFLAFLMISLGFATACDSDDSTDGQVDGDLDIDTVGVDDEPVEFDKDPVDDDDEPVEVDNEPVEGDDEPVDGDNELVDGDDVPVEIDNDPVDADGESVEIDDEPVDGDDEPVEIDNEPVDDDDEQSTGSWLDTSSGLLWQNPPAPTAMGWNAGKQYCSNLNLDGYDDWRLPTISELRSLVWGCPDTETGGDCGVTDACASGSCNDGGDCETCPIGDGLSYDGCYWSDEVQGSCDWHWSSSPVTGNTFFAWGIHFYSGRLYYDDVSYDYTVRCVR